MVERQVALLEQVLGPPLAPLELLAVAEQRVWAMFNVETCTSSDPRVDAITHCSQRQSEAGRREVRD